MTKQNDDPRTRKAIRQTIPLSLIQLDQDTQARVRYEPGRVGELTAILAHGIEFNDVIEVYFDEAVYWIGDGFHRTAAYRNAGRTDVIALVREGNKRDAMRHAVGANAAHGSPRRAEDVRRAIRLLLDDKEYAQWSNVRLASMVRCSDKTVAAVRDESGRNGTTRTYLRNGRETTIAIAPKPSPKTSEPLTTCPHCGHQW